ncbi:MAG: sulfite exporter TauE/SafE family protein [Chloroflexi bacterium]|nr:sulfite exporter TauE/SafE family protein [Chloroflexota bacterium]
MEISLFLIAGGIGVGIFGSLLGLGGGILIVPFLTLIFNLPLRDAIGVSLVCVIMTSGAAAGVFLERRVANLRLGMVLELFTAIGALIGGLVAFLLDQRVLAGLFAVLMAYVAITMFRAAGRTTPVAGESTAELAASDSGLAAAPGDVAEPPATAPVAVQRTFFQGLAGADYEIHRPLAGAVGSVGAGLVSALLGVGGGIVKVPVMHLAMGVPLRVATATSNLMIGITASTSAIIYLIRGGIDPFVAGPTAVGVFVGASIGSRIGHRIDLRVLRFLFVAILAYTAFQMARRALGIG